MKKLQLFTVWLALMTTFYSNAQTLHHSDETILLGPVAGLGSSWVRYATGIANSVTAGYGGIGLIDMKGPHWGWGGYLAVSSEGFKVDYPSFQQSDVPLYLRMPLRAYYFFSHRSRIVRPDIYFGPAFGMKLSEHINTTSYFGEVTRVQNGRNFRLFDAGLDGGAGVDVQLAKSVYLNVDLGYYQGITDAVKDAADTYNPEHDVDLNLSLFFDLK